MKNPCIYRGTRAQRGAALVVGLILMLVLTVLGVSGMTLSISGLRMASNAQDQQNAFQAAETGIDIQLERRIFDTSNPVNLPATPLGDGTFSVSAVQVFQQATPVPSGGFSLGELQAFHFDIQATGTGPRNAMSVQNQGFFLLGPGD